MKVALNASPREKGRLTGVAWAQIRDMVGATNAEVVNHAEAMADFHTETANDRASFVDGFHSGFYATIRGLK